MLVILTCFVCLLFVLTAAPDARSSRGRNRKFEFFRDGIAASCFFNFKFKMVRSDADKILPASWLFSGMAPRHEHQST
jgi:hypothetical protein